MSKINLRVFIGLALFINVFSYLGLRTVQWVWMNQNDFVNYYLPYLGLSRIDLVTLIYLILPDLLPILLLAFSLIFADKKHLVILFAALAFVLRMLAYLMSILYTTFWGGYEWTLGFSIGHATRYQLLGFTDFTFLLDSFGMLVTLGSQASLLILASVVIQRMRSERNR